MCVRDSNNQVKIIAVLAHQCDELLPSPCRTAVVVYNRQILADQLNISPHQLSYVTHSGEGEGLLFYGNVILPFVDRFPTDLELYRIMTVSYTHLPGDKYEVVDADHAK